MLKEFLYEAIFIPEGVEAPPRDIVERPELRIYYDDFGTGPADYCLVAEANGRVVGAVWTRIMRDYGYVDDETPSFAISPLTRGKNWCSVKPEMPECPRCGNDEFLVTK